MSNAKLTPLELRAMLELFVGPHSEVLKNVGFLQKDLYAKGLIDRGDELAGLTELAQYHVALLLSTPFPRKQWVGPDGKRIEVEA